MNFNRTKKATSSSEINLTPLIDVVFLLLIFFMVTTTFVQDSQLDIELPKSDQGESQLKKNKNLTIMITRDGTYHVKGPEDEEARKLINVQRKTILMVIDAYKKQKDDLMVLITADTSVEFGFVFKVLDVLIELEWERVSFTIDSSSDAKK